MTKDSQLKVLIFQGVFQYGVVNHFASQLAEGFRQLGFEPIEINLSDTDLKVLTEVPPEKILCAISFNTTGSDITGPDGKNYYDSSGVPVIQLMVDDPILHLSRLTRLNNQYITCPDLEHVDFLHRCGATNSGLLLIGAPSNLDLPVVERDIDVLFPGTISQSKLDNSKWKEDFPQIANLLHDVADQFNPHEGPLLEQLVRDHPIGQKLFPDNSITVYFEQSIKILCMYLRYKFRLELVKNLDDLGLQLSLVGEGWESYQFKNHKILPSRPFKEIIDLMNPFQNPPELQPFLSNGDARSANLRDYGGAYVMTDANPLLQELFEPDEVGLYNPTDPASLVHEINEILSKKLDRLANKKGQMKMQGAHLFKHRAAALLQILEPRIQNLSAQHMA